MTRTTACASLAECAATGLWSLDACTGVAQANKLNRANKKVGNLRLFFMFEMLEMNGEEGAR